ncbi:MAG: class I SAM-dependent methyltransferase [Chloroflexi bacterium]|nr:class I SAM-dependent methyltransferase [Chloroflexota bacterium]
MAGSTKIDYDRIAQEYARNRQVHPQVLRSLISGSQLNNTSRFLEVGCGTGNYLLALQQESGASAWGIDPSVEMREIARQRSPMLTILPGSAESLAFPTGYFDLVFSVDVIHHISRWEAYYHDAFRVLRQGGKICTVTDSEDIIRRRMPLSVYFPETIEIELSRYPRIAVLKSQMVNLGFIEIIEEIVERPYLLTDLRSFREKAFSSLHLISTEAFNRGLNRMELDLQEGPIQCVSRYMLLWGTKPE